MSSRLYIILEVWDLPYGHIPATDRELRGPQSNQSSTSGKSIRADER